MKLARLLVSVLALLALGVFASSADAAKAKPNLKISKLVLQTVSTRPGNRIVSTATVANKGTASAGKSETTFLLSTDALKSKNDTILQFRQRVGKLKKKKSATAMTEGTVPTSIVPGSYFVGACADGTSKVKESKEADNCTFAKTPISVTAIPAPGFPGGPGGSDVVVVPANFALPSISGAPGVGRALTAIPGTWSPADVFRVRSWLLCTDASTLDSCTAIPGAEGATYTPVAGDANKFIRLRETATITISSTTATSEATTAVVPDSDADGTPDDTDCAPVDSRLPGEAHPNAASCVGRIYDASNGNGADGAIVALSNVLVTAVKSVDDGTIYVQAKPGDAIYDLVLGPKHSGLQVSGASGRSVGDRLNLYGTLDQTSTGYVLEAESIDVLSSLNEATSPATISFTEFLTNGVAFDGALLSFPSITITSIDSAGWHLDLGGTPMIVDKTLIGTLPAAVNGQNISALRGIGQSFDSNFKLMPRTTSDIVLDPVG